MARTKRRWVPVLVGLLVAVLLGPAGGAVATAEPRVMVANIMVPAAAFVPNANDFDYTNGGLSLSAPGEGFFMAQVAFPVRVVSIRRITLYAADSSPSSGVSVNLVRVQPAGFSQVQMGSAYTGDSGPQAVSTTAISPRRLDSASQAAVLSVLIAGPDAAFVGVKVTYSYETAP